MCAANYLHLTFQGPINSFDRMWSFVTLEHKQKTDTNILYCMFRDQDLNISDSI